MNCEAFEGGGGGGLGAGARLGVAGAPVRSTRHMRWLAMSCGESLPKTVRVDVSTGMQLPDSHDASSDGAWHLCNTWACVI